MFSYCKFIDSEYELNFIQWGMNKFSCLNASPTLLNCGDKKKRNTILYLRTKLDSNTDTFLRPQKAYVLNFID